MRPIGRALRAVLIAGALLAPARATGADDEGFETVAVEDGFTVDRRPGQRSACDEVRVSTVVPVPFELVATVIWGEELDRDVPSVLRYEVMPLDAATKRVWGLLDVPFLADREYTLRVERIPEDEGRIVRVQFDLEPDAPLRAEAVPLRTLAGGWRVGPAEGAQATRLEYRVEVDPGSVPAWLTSRLQRESALALVRSAVARSERRFAEQRATALESAAVAPIAPATP